MKSQLFVGAAFALIMSTPALAQTQPRIGQEQVLFTVTAEDVAATFRENGYTAEIDRSGADAVVRGVNPATSFRANAQVRICDRDGYPPGCLGVLYFISWTVNSNERTAALAAAKKYNDEYYVGKVIFSPDGSNMLLVHYQMVDYGVTRRNLSENWKNFIGSGERLVELWNQGL